MSDKKLGNRHACEECGTKYYDLGKTNAPCPKCGATPAPPKEEPARKSAAKARSRKVSEDDDIEEMADLEVVGEEEEGL